MALDRITSSRYLVPLGAILALAVAVGVWLVPSSALDPNPTTPREIRGTVPEPPDLETQSVPERKEWLEVAERLDALREPDPNVAEEEEEEPEEEQVAEQEDPDQPPPPPVTVRWEYEGLVEQPDRVAALIRVQGNQRFVFEGQVVDDPSLPPGTTATIARVERDRLIVRIDGGEQTIERSNDAPPVRAPDPRRRS